MGSREGGGSEESCFGAAGTEGGTTKEGGAEKSADKLLRKAKDSESKTDTMLSNVPKNSEQELLKKALTGEVSADDLSPAQLKKLAEMAAAELADREASHTEAPDAPVEEEVAPVPEAAPVAESEPEHHSAPAKMQTDTQRMSQ